MSEEIKEILDELESLFEISEVPEHIINGFNKIKDYITNLQQKVEQLENIRKEATEYIKNNKETREHYEPYGTPMGNSNYTTTHIFGYYELLDILNKGDNNGK